MSQSQRLLSHYVRGLLGISGVALTVACGTPSVACIGVEPEEECPSVEEAAEILVGTDQCAAPVETVLAVMDFKERHESYGEELPLDSCCYDVRVRKKVGLNCAIGRPLTHAGSPVLAEVIGGQAWRGEGTAASAALPEEASQALFAYWTEVARMEHASVAAFARVALELMALGAPSELVEGAHAAALDEVRHARAAFTLASGYGDRPVGPGALQIPRDVLANTDLVSLAVATVREGCVGESLAAVLAAEQLRHATDPAVVAALSRVVEEEAQHAELGWAIVRWAVQAGGEPVREAVARAFDEAVGVPDLSLFPEPIVGAEGHGLVSRARLAEVVEGAIRAVILPSAAEILA